MVPLFETKEAKARVSHRVFAATGFVGICFILIYRLVNFPKEEQGGRRRWAWIGIFMAEFFFSLFWIITQSVRWSVRQHLPFKDRLSLRLAL